LNNPGVPARKTGQFQKWGIYGAEV